MLHVVGRKDVASSGLNRPVLVVTRFRGRVDIAFLIAQLLSLAERRGQVSKQSPEMLFKILLPKSHNLMHHSLE